MRKGWTFKSPFTPLATRVSFRKVGFRRPGKIEATSHVPHTSAHLHPIVSLWQFKFGRNRRTVLEGARTQSFTLLLARELRFHRNTFFRDPALLGNSEGSCSICGKPVSSQQHPPRRQNPTTRPPTDAPKMQTLEYPSHVRPSPSHRLSIPSQARLLTFQKAEPRSRAIRVRDIMKQPV